jgi:hypothetical protein
MSVCHQAARRVSLQVEAAREETLNLLLQDLNISCEVRLKPKQVKHKCMEWMHSVTGGCESYMLIEQNTRTGVKWNPLNDAAKL